MMEKRINRLAAALLLLLSAAFSSKAQFRYYTTDRGLPSNTVRTLLQDSDGIVWAGTSYGLCWCNGNEFTPCVPPPGEEWGKSVFDICESKDTKTLWIGTFEGIYCKYHGSRSTTRLHIDSLDGPTAISGWVPSVRASSATASRTGNGPATRERAPVLP